MTEIDKKIIAENKSIDKDKAVGSKKTAWFTIGLIIILILLIGGIVFLMLQIPKKALSVRSLRTKLIASQMSEQDRLILIQALKETETERERLAKAFPDEEQILDFIKLIDEIKNSQVKILKFSVDGDVPTKIGKNPSFLPITLMLSGKESDVDLELKKIADSSYFIRPLYISKEYDVSGEIVTLQTQFHIYVSDQFVKVKNK